VQMSSARSSLFLSKKFSMSGRYGPGTTETGAQKARVNFGGAL
jgi:hypothetical protein